MRLRKSKLLAAALTVAVMFGMLPGSLVVRAEEGMFMMDKLAGLPLAQKGLKISPTEIYNPAGGGLSEAVVQLSIGCTGEFVSPDGLILTNHHCAYDALVAASTPRANYGEVGYKADSREQELPAKDYSVKLTLKSEDVTAQVLNGIDRNNREAVAKRIEDLQKAEKLGADQSVQIQPLNNGLFFYKFVYQTVSDIRIAYAPPKSIGFYGGDPDNFEWTRHCGDFTFMRAYVGKDGKAAAYSKENVPFKPKKYLTMNTGGVKENDFTMIIGYPGGTNRYRESMSVAYNQDINLPFVVESLNAQIQALEMVGRNNADKRVKLQADIFSLANGLKAYEGGIVAMRRANLVAQKKADEARFAQWVAADATRQAKYGNVLSGLQTAFDDYLKTARKDLIYKNMPNIKPVELVLGLMLGALDKTEANEAIAEVLKSEPGANRDIFKFYLRKAAELPADQRIAAIEKRFGNLSGEARTRAEDEFARSIFESQFLTTEAGLKALVENVRSSQEPLVVFLGEIAPEIGGAFQTQQAFNAKINPLRLLYTEGMAAMKNSNPYPDANFTQRFTYGAVKGYSPKEAVTFTPFTTLSGVFEKDTGREPFNAPEKLRRLWMQRNLTEFHDGGSVPVNFLTTNDIIGGNSGSPVLNANGEQVGIAFDGNYEGLGNDFFFSDALGRTIIVDIRYVLYLTKYFGEAGWIVDELTVKGKSAAAVGGK